MSAKRPTAYVSGPYTALTPEDTRGNIDKARRVGIRLMYMGWAPIVPHTLTAEWDVYAKKDRLTLDWRDFLDVDIELMWNVAMVIMLPDWQNSAGAQVEHGIAVEIGIPVFYINDRYDKSLPDPNWVKR